MMPENRHVNVKICGIREMCTARTAIEAGANWLGFVHFESSPRHLPREEGKRLLETVKAYSGDVETVLLLVNPSLNFAIELAEYWGVDHIQLHGNEQEPLLADIKSTRPDGEVWKALPISNASDLSLIQDYPSADRFLFDAKPPKHADRPGGLGESFDWTLLNGIELDRPWLLAGGLTPANAAQAVKLSGAKALDVSSGVESALGVKSADLIKGFCGAVRS